MKDPTANAAARNVTGQERAAVINYREDGHPARLWLDSATLNKLASLVVILTDDTGERHIRFREETKS
ncbi:hypothetical protein [Microbacterium hydrocarbonoxydans]|uniref:hypothetical protein n=1 Tax=Microbacterium hydrocarbonoxydans TaxID=273678 RepID=UPI00203E35A1|nr:hypothetical protein [Microbacterium hydrocarbonoxydans]MCM3779872.1 hypothetical protein [Microbacterium hydrocarbonoxydans]